MPRPLYEEHASSYARTRRPDPRIAAVVEGALGDAKTVVNVGAGTGSYEPQGRAVTAVEPSAEMISQRPAGAAPAVQASAEALPFADDEFDAAMAVLTLHHWADLDTGLAELRRVASRRLVLVTFDPEPLLRLWLVQDYFPAIVGLHAERISSRVLAVTLPATSVESIPVPRDCTDLFFAALWARPELLLDPDVVRPMWVWQNLAEEDLVAGRARLATDLESGAWEQRHGDLRGRAELDVGLRLVVSDLDA